MGNGESPAVVFGRRMREERERLGWRLADLASAVADQGVIRHLTAYAKTEAGEREPKISEAAAIAAALHLPLSALLAADGGKTADLSAELTQQAHDAARESNLAMIRAVALLREAQELIRTREAGA